MDAGGDLGPATRPGADASPRGSGLPRPAIAQRDRDRRRRLRQGGLGPGPANAGLALLDPDLRHAVATLVGGRLDLRGHRPLWVSGQLDGGVLRLDLPEHVPQLRHRANDQEQPPAGEVYLDGRYSMPQVLRAALDLAGRLEVPEHLAARLAANLKTEPEAGVRRKTLARLLSEFPEGRGERCGAAGRTRRPRRGRARARRGRARQGRPRRAARRRLRRGRGRRDDRAGRGGARHVAHGRGGSRAAARRAPHAAASDCERVPGDPGTRSAAPRPATRLAKVLLRREERARRSRRPRARGERRSRDGGAALARAGRGRSRPAARRSLGAGEGRHAGRRRPAAYSERDPELRAAARQAIAEIHSRLAGAEQGQLSLSEDVAGRVSLGVEGEAGRLSLSEEKTGEVRS